jgi:chromosome segregation ATPase
MEHRAGVLSFSVRNMERKMAPSDDSGYDSSNRSTLMSPTMSSNTGFSSPTTTVSSSKSRFDGAHLFAGHADSIVPKVKLSSEAAAAAIAALEMKLKTAKDSLAAAGKKQVEMTRELSLMKLEKQEVETMMGMDIQAAEETIAVLEKEIPRLEVLDSEVRQLRQEKTSWERDRMGFETKLMELNTKKGEDAGGADRMLASMQKDLEAKDAEIRRIQEERERERSAWVEERQQLEDEKMDDLARLQEEMDRMRDEEDQTVRQSHDEMSSGLAILQSMVRTHGIVLFSRDSSLQGLLNAVGMHIESVHMKLETYSKAEAEWESLRRKLEEDVRNGLDKREAMVRELEDARRERDSVRNTLTLESRVKAC